MLERLRWWVAKRLVGGLVSEDPMERAIRVALSDRTSSGQWPLYRVEWTDEDGKVHSIYKGTDGGRAVELWEGCCASNLVGELRFLDALRGERGHVVKHPPVRQ